MASPHRVVITGIGLLTPIGSDAQQNWESLQQGRSGLQIHPDYDARVIVGLVADVQPLLDSIIPAKEHRRTARFMHLALIAAREALQDAHLIETTSNDRDRFGVYLGVGVGGLGTIGEASVAYEKNGSRAVSPFMLTKAICNEAASWLCKTWQLRGPSVAIVNACSSGADAIGLAYRAIRDGYADTMLTGGAESCITGTSLAAFGNMRALSRWQGDPAKASRPFDKERTGFVMAEGAGILVLERLDCALERGASIYAEITGYGATADAYHITAMHPEGRGAQRAIECALMQGNVTPEQIDYINAHGTGTPMNDAIETAVIKKVFKDHANPQSKNHLLVSSTKSMTGHMLGAAGGAEVSYAAFVLQKGKVPPTINRETPDPACDLDYVTQGARERQCTYVLSHSFGFGGGNAVLLLKRWMG